MPDTREPSGGLLGLAAVGMIACCGLPALLAGGLVLSAAGLAVGSLIVVALGAGLAVWGWRGHTARRCETRGAGPARYIERLSADASNAIENLGWRAALITATAAIGTAAAITYIFQRQPTTGGEQDSLPPDRPHSPDHYSDRADAPTTAQRP